MEVDQLIPASKKRLVLSVYIDFLLFSALWGLGSYFLVTEGDTPFWLQLAVFSVLEAMLMWQFSSPGLYFLSIYSLKRSTTLPDGPGSLAIGSFVVEPAVYEEENWLTMLLGVVCILEGAKSMVRWTQWAVPIPLLGMPTEPVTFAVISSFWGVLLIYLGYAFFKLKRTAPEARRN